MSEPDVDLERAAEAAVRLHGRSTSTRVAVLARLMAAPTALTHAELEADLEGVDRVTLYRVLDWLVAQGLAHRIAGEDRVWRFAAAMTHGGHAHFRCDACAQVYCLPQLQPVVALSLPPGFSLRQAELTVHGLCPRCSG
jgi:Fur family ferric uptake transcriptional regulator